MISKAAVFTTALTIFQGSLLLLLFSFQLPTSLRNIEHNSQYMGLLPASVRGEWACFMLLIYSVLHAYYQRPYIIETMHSYTVPM